MLRLVTTWAEPPAQPQHPGKVGTGKGESLRNGAESRVSVHPQF